MHPKDLAALHNMDMFVKVALPAMEGEFPRHWRVAEATWDNWAWSLDFWAMWSLWQDISLCSYII